MTRRSALMFTTAALLAASGSVSATPHVLVFGVDGLRPDALEAADTPWIDSLIANGTYSDNATSSDLTFSGPGYSDILLGVHRDDHGVATNSVSGGGSVFSGSNQASFPDILAMANTADPALHTGRWTTWSPLHTTRTPGGSDYAFFHEYNANGDALAAADATNYYANNDVDLGFIYFADIDVAGHGNGFNPTVAAYRNEITSTDALIGQVLAAIQDRPDYAQEDWVFILTSDHGGDSGGGHSGNNPWQREVPFIVSGDSARNGALGYGAKQVDVAVTALTHLGVAIPSHLVGHAVGLDSVADPRPTLGFGKNLVFNGDAEYDHGSMFHGMDQAVTGWEEFRDADFINETSSRDGFDTVTVLQYGTGGGFPLATDPGPDVRGTNFFSAGASSSSSEMFQQLDVSALAAQIDAGQIDFDLSGYLGGYIGQPDRAEFFVRFLDENGSEISATTLGEVTNADRGDETGLLLREADGTLVAGTRMVELVLTTIENDGYADNLGFELTWTVEGDLNADGFVGMEDLEILLAHWGQDVAPSSLIQGDASGNGVIDAADLDVVRNNWGAGEMPDVNIPEPGTLVLLAMGGLLATRRRR